MPHEDFDFDLKSLPWPDDNTQIFRADGAWYDSVFLAWIPDTATRWHLYAQGYREAAERLLASCEGRVRPDYLIFPMVFLYRHYVELRLKELLQSASEFLKLPEDWKCDHRIDKLWGALKPLMCRIFANEPDRDRQNVERLLRELAARDPISQEFRYPSTREGKQHLADLERLDMANFFDAMRKLSAFLDGASVAIGVYQEQGE